MDHKDVARALFHIGAIQFGSFKLKLHEVDPTAPLSPFYINLRILRSFPEAMHAVALVYGQLAKDLDFDLLADVPTSITPVVAILAYLTKRPMITPRQDIKTHGLKTGIDGVFREGQSVLLLDDVITSADSKFDSIRVLEDQKLVVRDVIVLVDRQQQGAKKLSDAGYYCHSAFTIKRLLDFYLEEHLIPKSKHDEALAYITS